MSEKIREMFDSIAGDYDRMNRIMTFGLDRKWRRFVVSRAGLSDGMALLDIATGTGDIAFEALRRFDLEVTGLDFSSSMLEIARVRDREGKVRWIQGDALKLPFGDGSFDAVTSGYLMRNVGDIGGAFAEQYRVLKEGGTVVCLDTTPPGGNIFSPFVRLYLKMLIPLLGRILAGNRGAYAYLTESTVKFKSPGEIRAIMESCGFRSVSIKKFMFGTIAIHCGIKEKTHGL